MEINMGDIIYFYYDSMVTCQKGKVLGTTQLEGWYNIEWLSEISGKPEGCSGVYKDRIFKTRKECADYAEETKKRPNN